MDNTLNFKKYNAGLSAGDFWQESPFFIQLQNERRQRSVQMAREKKQRLKHQELQRTVLQLLIDAHQQPVPINKIANHLGHSRRTTVRFLSTHADDLWIGVNGGRELWVTSLKFLPDRLFH